MSPPNAPRLFRLKIARPRIEVAIIDVEASSEAEAEALALQKAGEVDQSGWHGSFDPHLYACDVQFVGDSEEAAANDDPLDNWRELDPIPDSETRYGLLRADLGSGEGKFLPQPWMEDGFSGLLLADVTGDWAADLAQFIDDSLGPVEDEDEDEMDEGALRAAYSRLPFPAAEDAKRTVISLDAHRQRRQRERFELKREYSVTIMVRGPKEDPHGGMIGFSFEGIDLTRENIDDITDDVQFVADRLRDDRSGLLEDS